MSDVFSLLSVLEAYEDYYDLDEEDRAYSRFVCQCLYFADEKISSACSDMFLFILEVSNSFDTGEEYTKEEVKAIKEKIYKNLNKEEIEIVENFGQAVIKLIGIYDRKSNEYNLRRERK